MKKIVLGILIGIIIGSSSIVIASGLFAKDINYKNTNVENALDELYTKTDTYKSLNIELDAGTYSNATWGMGEIVLTNLKSKYKYFKITKVESLTPNYSSDNYCVPRLLNGKDPEFDANTNTVYETNDYLYIRLLALSNTNNKWNNCREYLYFYN